MESNQNQAQTMNQRNTQIAIGIAVVVVVGLLAWWLFSKPAADMGSMATSTGTAMTGTSSATASADEDNMDVAPGSSMPMTNETITVNDQPAGDSVRVASVTLAKNGWVAVRDSLRVYGAAWLTAGTHENISVPLLRNTSAGTTYSVVLYVDNGDKSFDLHGDATITGVSGTFSATNGD